MKAKKSLLILGAAILSFGAINFLLPRNNSVKAEAALNPPFTTYANHDGATYYNSISDSLTGNDLLLALRSLNNNRKKASGGYKPLLTGNFLARWTDYDPNNYSLDANGQQYSTTILSFYSGNKAVNGNGMNREHVWPDSRGGNLVESDTHMARPTLTSENSSRGNSYYVEGMESQSAGWDPAMPSFGEESYRGDSARIIFYCAMANSSLSLLDATSGGSNTMGKLSDLLKWNINYAPQVRETNRNEGTQYIQGNRNPFIDHPEYACRIWGNTNSTTKKICDGAVYPTETHYAGIRSDDGYNISSENITTYTLNVDETVNFLPFVDGVYNAGVSWSLSDTTVASQTYYGRSSYTNGVTITGLKAGTSTLTLSYNYDDNGTQRTAISTCLITVKDSGSGGGGEEGQTYSITFSDLDNSYPTSAKDYTAASGIKFKALNCANYSSKVQFKKSGGYIYNTESLNLSTVKLNGTSGSGTITVYGGSSSNPETTAITGSSGEYNLSGYNYFKIANKSSNAVTCTSIDVTTASAPSAITLSSIAASGMTTEYNVGDTFSFDGDLTATYSDDSTKEVTPTSVSSPDMSTAGTKTVTISYTEGGVTKTTTYDITVSAVVVPVTGVTLNKTSTSIEEGSSETLTATVLPSNATNKNVTWSTSNSGVATVNNGTVTAVKAGTATITVTTEDGSKAATCNVTVTEKVIPTPSGDYSLTDKSPYINGVPYKMYFSNASNTYYFNGEKTSNTYYGDTTTVAENAVDVYFEEDGDGQNVYFIKDNVRQYLNIVKSSTYFNFSFSTTEPEIKWLYVTNDSYSAITYSVEGVPYTFGNKKNTSYSTFATVNLNNNPDGYKVDFICINQDYASVYATVINSYITCDSTGDTAPKFANGYTWNNFAIVFSKFSNDVRDLFTGTSTNEDIKDFTARYDYIVAKYGYTNFLSRDVSPLASRFNLVVNSEDNSMIIIVVIASVTALAFTTLLIIKKKKHR